MKAELFRDIASRYASLVGRRDGVMVQFMPGTAAYTNGKQIVIPDVPYGTVLSEHQVKVYGGYLDHEAAHCRETDFRELKDLAGDLRWLQNVLEDVRIENLQISRYPGMKAYLDALCEEVDSRTPKNPNRIMSALYKEIWKYRGVDVHRVPETLDGLGLSGTAALVAQIAELVSTEQTVKLAKRILDLLRHEVKQQEEERKNEQKAKQEGIHEEGDAPAGQQGQAVAETGEQDSEQDQGPSGEGNNEAKDDGGAFSSQPPEPNGNGASSGEGSAGSVEASEQGGPGGVTQSELDSNIEAMTQAKDNSRQQALKDALQGEMVDGPVKKPEGVRKRQALGTMILPPVDKSKDEIMVRPTRTSTTVEKVQATKLATELMRVLQARDKRAWKRDQEDGDLDTDSLPSVATGNTRVYQTKRDRVAVSTAIEVELDLSGSMSSTVVRGCAMQLAEALNAVPRVKFQICGFHAPEYPELPGTDGLGRKNHMRFEVLKRFEESYATARKYIQGVKAEGFTPLGEAYAIGMENLIRRKERKKVLLVVTDGMPEFHVQDSRHSDFLLMSRINKTCAKYGILTAGLVIGNLAFTLKNYFRFTESFSQGDELQASLLKLVGKLV